MGIRRKLETIAGMLLILMLASGVRAASADLHETNFQTNSGIFPFANVLRVGDSDPDLNLSRFVDLSQSQFKFSDEPMPVTALLILVGLIALIALKGRRK